MFRVGFSSQVRSGLGGLQEDFDAPVFFPTNADS